MEEWEKEIIVKNMDKLVKTTICNVTFLATLQASGILSEDDLDVLMGLKGNRGSQVFLLYNILQKRSNAFEALLEGLQQTKQSGAVAILKTALGQMSSSITLTISYDVNNVLGQGSNGTVVYKGTFGGRHVAVKKVYVVTFGGAQALHEINVLKDIDAHESVVRYFGAKQTNEFILIALELCEMSLKKWVDNNSNTGPSTLNKPPEFSCIDVLRQITFGLEWLHSNKIVHRDIKPENVLLMLQLKRAKLSDFGLSRRISDGGSFVATSNASGTPGWMSPEILACVVERYSTECKFTYASDVFSLGCVYYYVLTNGKYAFGDMVRCQANILDGKSLIVENEMKHGSSMFNLIKLMISKDPKSRPTCSTLVSYSHWLQQNSRNKFIDRITQSTFVHPEISQIPASTDCPDSREMVLSGSSGELRNKMSNDPGSCTPFVGLERKNVLVSSSLVRYRKLGSDSNITGALTVPIVASAKCIKTEVKKPTWRVIVDFLTTKQKKLSKLLKQLTEMDLEMRNATLIELVRNEDLYFIQGVLDHVGSRITNICDASQKTMLHIAVARGDYDIVVYLIGSKDFDSVLREPMFKDGAIHDCIRNIHELEHQAYSNKCRILELLFSVNPQLIESRENTWTPIHHAAKREFTNGKQLDFIQFLLNHHANVNAETMLLQTPLHFAVKEYVPNNIVEIIGLLITHGADTDTVDARGYKFWEREVNEAPLDLYKEILKFLIAIDRLTQDDVRKKFQTFDDENCIALLGSFI